MSPPVSSTHLDVSKRQGKDGRWGIKRYWAAELPPEEGRTFEDHVEALSSVLQDSARAHMIADVEVGSFLSLSLIHI